MTRPDFEVAAGFRAARLRVRVPPGAATSGYGDVALERERVRSGLPASQTAPGGRYEEVTVRTCLFASVQFATEEHEAREVR